MSSVVGVARRMKFSPASRAGVQSSEVFLRRQVHDDQAIDAGVPGVAQKGVDAVNINRIVVAHQHDGGGVVSGAKVGDEL